MLRLLSVTSRVTWFEAAVLAAVAILLSIQLFVPPIVGMADNGDFAKVAMRLCMEPEGSLRTDASRYFHFSVAQYQVAPQYCLAFWQWSSMSVIAWIAKQAHDVAGRESEFDIRALGAVCAVLWLIGVWAMLRLSRHAPLLVRLTGAGVAVILLTDVFFVAYFQSFYGDCAAMIFLFATCILAWRAAQQPSSGRILFFAASASLLVWSKGPHALIAPWLVAFSAFWWYRTRVHAWAWSAAFLLAVTAASLASVPADYGAGTTFNVIFTRLVPTARNPVPVLAAFDLPPEAVKYSGEYVYTATTPFKDREWRAQYGAGITPHRLLRYYVHNPQRAFDNLWRDLVDSQNMRVYAFYWDPEDPRVNRPVRSLLGWSDVRSWLIRSVPVHMFVLYAAFLVGGFLSVWRGTEAWQLIGGSLSLALTGAALTEFATTSLFDALDTSRHLFMFHVLTDALIVHAALAAAWLVARKMAWAGAVSGGGLAPHSRSLAGAPGDRVVQ